MTAAAPPRLDIVIPVYNEGANIAPTLRALANNVKTPLRVLICYDREDDNTLPAIAAIRGTLGGLAIDNVRIVPGGSSVRRGAHVASGVVCMPPPVMKRLAQTMSQPLSAFATMASSMPAL